MNEKLADIEARRDNKLKREKKIAKMADGPERRKLMFQASTEEKAMARKKTDYCIQEQEVHESYQLLLKVNTYSMKSPPKRFIYPQTSYSNLLVLSNGLIGNIASVLTFSLNFFNVLIQKTRPFLPKFRLI